MEIRRDPEFHQPPRIPGNPHQRNEDKYCDFHEQTGHFTEGYITLSLLIEELIKNGKLIWFLGEQRNRPEIASPVITGTTSPRVSSDAGENQTQDLKIIS